MINEIKRLTRGAPNRPAIPPEDEVLWTLFERDFRNAFTDSQKQLSAHQKFLKVKMQGNALDEFIAEFEHLRSEAGWSSNDIGTITQFRRGLNTGVRLKLAFCTTCAVRVLVLAQGPSFLRLRRALLRRRGDSQDKRNATITSGGVETIQRSCSTSTKETEVVWKW